MTKSLQEANWVYETSEWPYKDLRARKREQALSPRLLDLIRQEQPQDKILLDVGCGGGRLTFAIAPFARLVIGIDHSAQEIAVAGERARRQGVANVYFLVADAEVADYRQVVPGLGMVVAYLCMSDAILMRAGQALSVGSAIVFAAFHTEQWRETGRVSSWAYSEAQMEDALARAGFVPEHLAVEREVIRFASREEALGAELFNGLLKDKWLKDGRWEGYLRYLEGGEYTITRSHVVVKARKQET